MEQQNPRIASISSLLKRWCAEQRTRTCENMFVKFMRPSLTATEAKKFFEHYASEPCLAFYSPGGRMCRITVQQDHFNPVAVAEIAEKIGLSDTIDPRHKTSKNSSKSSTPKVETPKAEPAKVDLTKISTEELAAELTSRGWTIAYGLI